MKEQLISFETAKLAKEKGFDEITQYIHDQGKVIKKPILYGSSIIKAPTQSLLQKWLREEKDCHIDIKYCTDPCYVYDITIDAESKYFSDLRMDFKTHEEALEEGLKEALKLI